MIYNANPYPVTVKIPKATWYRVLSGDEINLEPMEKAELKEVTVDGVRAAIFYTPDQVVADDLFSEAGIIKTRVNSNVFLTPSGQIAAEAKVKLEGNTFYLPLRFGGSHRIHARMLILEAGTSGTESVFIESTLVEITGVTNGQGRIRLMTGSS